MKLRFDYNAKTGYFTFIENNLLFQIPFATILVKGRKLIYYSDKESNTPVRDWYGELEDDHKQEILITPKNEI